MTNESKQQIVREAALKCAALVPTSAGLGPIDFEPIILSAIERAKVMWRKGRHKCDKCSTEWFTSIDELVECPKCQDAAQPQRSELTPEEHRLKYGCYPNEPQYEQPLALDDKRSEQQEWTPLNLLDIKLPGGTTISCKCIADRDTAIAVHNAALSVEHKVRGPLVDLLKASKGLMAFGHAQDWQEWEAARDDALGGMKEGKC